MKKKKFFFLIFLTKNLFLIEKLKFQLQLQLIQHRYYIIKPEIGALLILIRTDQFKSSKLKI